MLTALYIVAGLVLLFFGGELLIRGAISLAKALRISPFVIGLTVVAYGTSSPELVISLEAVFEGYPHIAMGNVIGSNISNILCVLGISALIYPVAIDKKIGTTESLVLLAVTLLLACVLWFADTLERSVGIGFCVILCVYTWFIFHQAKKTKDPLPEEQVQEMETHIQRTLTWPGAVALCVVGLVLLVVGANLLVSGTVSLARYWGVSEAAISVTLVAFGGSVPELVTSLIAALHKKSEIVIGNILGSNLFNILGILGITSLVKPMEIAPQFASFDVYVIVGVTAALTATVMLRDKIGRLLGALWFGGYIGYVTLQFI